MAERRGQGQATGGARPGSLSRVLERCVPAGLAPASLAPPWQAGPQSAQDRTPQGPKLRSALCFEAGGRRGPGGLSSALPRGCYPGDSEGKGEPG